MFSPHQQPNQRYNSYKQLLKITLNVSLSAFNFGFCNGYFNSISFDDIVEIFSLQGYSRSIIQGILTGSLSLTGGFGALISSYFLRKYTRKECYQIIGVSMVIVCFMMLFPHLGTLLVGRLAQGLIIGMTSSINPIYIKEFSPVELSGLLCPINQIMIIIGITYTFLQTYIFSLFLSPAVYWRLVFSFPIFSSLLMLYNLKYRYPYETPKYLILQNRHQQAKQLLSIIYKKQHIQQIYQSLTAAIAQQQQPNPNTQIQLQQLNINDTLSQKLLHINKPIQLTNNKLAVIAAFNLSIHQQFVGMGVIIAYSGEIVKLCFPALEKMFPVMVNLVAFVCVFVSVPVLKYFGRRRSLLYGGVSLAVCLFALARDFGRIREDDIPGTGYFVKVLALALILAIRGIFSVTLGPIVWVYSSEIVQPNILPYSVMVNWLTVFLINLTFPVLKELMGGNPGHIFDLYAFVTLVCYLINRYALIETAGKTQLQIRIQYDQKWK